MNWIVWCFSRIALHLNNTGIYSQRAISVSFGVDKRGCVDVFCFIGYLNHSHSLQIKKKKRKSCPIAMDLYSQFTWLNQLLRSQHHTTDAVVGSNQTENHAESVNANDESDSNETTNVYTSNNAVDGCRQAIDYMQLLTQFNQNNEHFIAALLNKGASPTAALASATQHKQQTTALIPPTPPRTPITPSAPQQQVSSQAEPHSFTQVTTTNREQTQHHWILSVEHENEAFTIRRCAPITIRVLFFYGDFAHGTVSAMRFSPLFFSCNFADFFPLFESKLERYQFPDYYFF